MLKNWVLKVLKLSALGLVFFIAASSIGATNQQMKQEDIRTLIKQVRDAWVARDADALVQLFTPDGEIIVPGERWRGRTKIREEVSRFAQQYTDVNIDIRRIIVEDNQAAVEWYYEDTEKATGLRNKADDVVIVDFKDGRISRWREYFDSKTPVSKQLLPH